MKSKQIFAIFIITLFVGSVAAYALTYSMPTENSQERRSRAYLQISTCNEKKEIPEVSVSNEGFFFNSSNEGIIEFSGKEIRLGKVFNLLNITFSKNELMNYTNDNDCPDLPSNEVHLFVKAYKEENFHRSNQYRDYLVKNGDTVQVSYY